MTHPARNTDPSTSHEAAQAVGNVAAKLRTRIQVLARAAGSAGITINEAAQQIPEHRATSISPRFAELVARGALIRVLRGNGRPTKRSPGGVPRYATRLDMQTKKNAIVHWLPDFVPTTIKAMLRPVREDKPAYTVAEVGALMSFSRQKITAMFQNEPGVIVLTGGGKIRRHRTLRIPRTVYLRVLGHITKAMRRAAGPLKTRT